MKWLYDQIVRDLQELKAQGVKADPYLLKEKYGYEFLSEFFPLLNRIGKEVKDLKEFIEDIFSKVTDSRDLDFRSM